MTASPSSTRRGVPDRPLSFLLHYVRARPFGFGAMLLLITIAASCSVGTQYGMKLLIDAMSAADRAAADVWSPLFLFIALIGIESVLWRLSGVVGCRTIVKAGVDMRVDLFRHLTGHSMRYFAEHFTGSLGGRITGTAGAAGSIYSSLTWNVLPPCVDLVGAVIVFMMVDARLAFVLVAAVVVVALLIVSLGLAGRALHHEYAEQNARVNGELVDVVANVWTVKAFSARERERERLRREFAIEAGAQRRSWMHIEKTRLVHDICLWVTAGGMLGWTILLWRQGAVTTGDVVVVSALTFRILYGSRDMALALVNAAQQFGVIADVLKVIARPYDIVDPATEGRFRTRGGAVSFEHVTFAYPGGREVFHDFNLQIAAGEKVGLAGPSGSGKTTLINLVQRLDDVQDGRILIDGHPITRMRQDDLRAHIAVVPQEIALFRRTIMENIRYGRPDASDEEVVEAARHAYCDAFIRNLPEGYGTLVGERGVNLSGGQRQRLGIARAFLKDAPILILDEATSALDSRSELEVQLALTRLVHGRTVIAIAHRLSTIANFDRVVVLLNGRIEEQGPPAQLRARGGLFSQLWKLQGAAPGARTMAQGRSEPASHGHDAVP
jgi:ATP-binding cassette, subfamily B, bacterial